MASEYSLGTATLGTEVDNSGLDKGIDASKKKAEDGALDIGKILKGALTVGIAGAAVGIGMLGAAVIGGIGDAQESVKLMAATEQTITTMGNAAGVSAQHVADMAAALSDANGQSLFGDDQIQQASNLLLTFGEIKGATFDAATALTVDLAQALGGAPKDQAMMLGKALNDPIHGMTALGKAGLTFSEEQKAAITAMQESGDMAGAQAVIIAELNKQVGGQAAAAANAAGGMVQFKANLGEVAESIGAAVLPMLNELGAWLNSPEVKAAIQSVADAMIMAFGWMHDNIPPIIKTVVDAVNTGIGIITSLFDGPMADSLDSNAAFFQSTFATVSAIVKDAAALIMAVLGAVAGFIKAHGTEIGTILSGAWNVIQGVITAVLALIQGVITTALALIKGDWSGAWDAIRTMSETFVRALGQIILGGLNIIAGFFGSSVKDILDTWRGNWNTLVEIVQALPGKVAGVGEAIVSAVWDGIRARWGELADWFNAKIQALRDKLPFSEPKDHTSPLYGLAKSGEALVGMLQAGIANAPPLDIAPLSMPDLRMPNFAGTALAGGAASASANISISLNEGRLRDLIRVEVSTQQNVAGTGAMNRIRNGGT